METNNEYQMFLNGYLEALTDIDGDQREFGAYVRVFTSSNKDHLLDIQKEFNYKKSIEITQSTKLYSYSFVLKQFIFVNLFNGAEVPLNLKK